jgi:hypothetical protein
MDLVAASGISANYASQILRGVRPCPNAVALTVFRDFGVRLGFLSDMTAEDIAKLCAQEGVGECVHAPSSPAEDGPSAKNGGDDFSGVGVPPHPALVPPHPNPLPAGEREQAEQAA